MISRYLDKTVENHFNSNKAALLLTGARQVGKTLAIRKYAQNTQTELVEINFFESARRVNEYAVCLKRNLSPKIVKMASNWREKTKCRLFLENLSPKCPKNGERINNLKYFLWDG